MVFAKVKATLAKANDINTISHYIRQMLSLYRLNNSHEHLLCLDAIHPIVYMNLIQNHYQVKICKQQLISRKHRVYFCKPKLDSFAQESIANYLAMWFLYACTVFSIKVATVIGPTPPGTGVMNEACLAASS